MKSVSSWVRGLFHRLRYYRIENPGLKLFALFLASLLFVISRQPLSDVRLVGVQLEYRGLAQGLEISGDMNQSVSVRLRGPRDVVRNIMPNQIAVVADLATKSPVTASSSSRPVTSLVRMALKFCNWILRRSVSA
jgi:hypothetical protein